MLVLGVGIYFSSSAQTIVSPYSNNGLGELVSQGMPNNIGMGGIGIGTPSYWQINSINPALLVNNTLTTFNVGFQADIRNFRASNTNGSDGTAGLRFLNISFPIIPVKWTSNVALLPFSTVNYDFFNTESIDGTDFISTNRFSGEGGISRLDWSNGIRIIKNLSLGVKTSYFFGSIRNALESEVQDETSPFSIVYNDEVSYNDFSIQFGGYYRYNISETRALNFGVIYSPSTTLSGSRNEFFLRRSNGRDIQGQDIDVSQNVEFTLPEVIGFGVSYQIVNKLILGTDVEINRGGEFSENENLFRRRLKVSSGAQWTPDYANVRSYFSRINYRFGLSFEQVPYIINDTEINDFGLSLGASMPIRGVSTLDLAGRYGWRGTTDNNLVRENYIQIVLGATINERWFIKRRFE